MLNCTDTVYILLLHSGLHLLHAPFRPKINILYGLLLLAMEIFKKKHCLLSFKIELYYFLGKLENEIIKMCPIYPL